MAEDTVSKPTGVPYPSANAGPLTAWCLDVYARLSAWAELHQGVWERWEPNYLVLTISAADGLPVEPAVIDTFDDELTVTFGYLECHIDGTDDEAIQAAKDHTEKWLSGEWSTAVYLKADGSWCGSRCIEGRELPEWLADTKWIEYFGPTHVEIRRARKSDWLRFAISNGKLAECTSV